MYSSLAISLALCSVKCLVLTGSLAGRQGRCFAVKVSRRMWQSELSSGFIFPSVMSGFCSTEDTPGHLAAHSMDWVMSCPAGSGQRAYFFHFVHETKPFGGSKQSSVGTGVYLVIHAAEHGLGSWDA